MLGKKLALFGNMKEEMHSISGSRAKGLKLKKKAIKRKNDRVAYLNGLLQPSWNFNFQKLLKRFIGGV